uniref:Cytoplasmic polyadenylation element-binding protein 1 n=1 Tax=Romanomermis culicivorax TaxID=13658 RepID=A0A915HJJ3_ROMCU
MATIKTIQKPTNCLCWLVPDEPIEFVQAEVKPYVLDDQVCDECNGALCHNKYAPFFCPNITCLQYYCEICWIKIHRIKGRENHKPLIKEGSDRPRVVSFNHRWI